MRAFYRMIPFLKQYKWHYLAGIFFLIAVDFLQLLMPQVLKNTTDLLQTDTMTMNALTRYVLLYIAIGLGISFGRFLWRIFIIGTSRRLEYVLRKDYFAHLQTLDTHFFHHHKTGDLMAHATNDIQTVRFAMGPGIMMAVDSTVMTILAIIIMYYTSDLQTTLISLATLPFLGFVIWRFNKVIHDRSRKVQDAFGKITDITQEYFTGIRVIQAFAAEDIADKNFSVFNDNNRQQTVKLIKVSGMLRPLVQLISAISFLVLLVYGAQRVMGGTMTLGSFIAVHNYIRLLVWPMMAVGHIVALFQRGVASMERLNEIMEQKPQIKDSHSTSVLPKAKGKVTFENVSFTYPGTNRPVLKNVSFSINPGETLGIIGPTGSGKSTISKLLVRLYDIQEGRILIDDVDITTVDLHQLREQIAYVLQDSFLFSDSIEENLLFSQEKKLPLEEIRKATEFAALDETIMEFPEQYDTVIGERGVTLSGGQKQRLSLARAIIKDAPILILDDSLSAVDAKTQDDILAHIRRVRQTLLLVSHRAMSVMHAENIIVLEEGEITAQGTHNELMEQGGYYHELYMKQQLEQKVNA